MYRGEIQNDSIGGNYNRSLDYSPSVGGLGAVGRDETRNFAVGAPLRGSGIGRCEEEAYNCCGLYGRGENEEMEDDPCWDGYEMIGTKMKKGREVPNCVPVGGYGERPEGATEVADMSNFIKRFSLGNKEFAGRLEKVIYGEGKPFTKEQLTKIILDKNKVIADLEENAYGEGWQEEMFSPEEMESAQKLWQEYLEKNPMVKGGYGERPEGATEVADMSNFIKRFSLGNKEFAGRLEKVIYGEGKPFTKEQLTKIILDKNKVIADLEENAYGGGWQEEMFSPEEMESAQKLWQEYLEKNPMVKGEGFWDDVRKGVVKHNERKKITPISKEDWKKQMEDFKAPTENWGADELYGGAAAKVEAKPSPVAAAAAALQPVRTAIQNKVGDLIYGAETDPKKQRKGLLGISEEGKEASKKKVIKNIVKPLMDGWNQLFNPDKVKEEAAARGRAEAKKAKAKAGWLYEMPDGTYDVLLGLTTDDPNAKLVRQPRRYRRWVVRNAKYNTGYWVDDSDEGAPPYIKIPNPIKGIKPNYTIDELKKNNIPFFVPVNRVNKTTDNEEVWRGLFEGDEIWVPQDNTASVLYQRLNEFKNKMAEEKERAYYESLSEVEKQEYRENKAIEKDTGMTEAAKAKVEKDIADEEAKEKPDTERLAKMKAAQERVRVKGVDNFWRVQGHTKKVSDRKYRERQEEDVRRWAVAEEKEKSDAAETWKAMTPAERTIQIDAFRESLRDDGLNEDDIEYQVSQIGEQIDSGALMVGRMGGGLAISKLIDESKRRDKADIARMPVSDTTPEERIRAEIRQSIATFGEEKAKWFNERKYEKLAALDAEYERVLARRIALAKEQGRPVNESAIAAMRRQRVKDTEDFAKSLKGGAGSDDEDDDDESVEEIGVIEVKVGKVAYLVDAPPMNENGERIGLPLPPYKRAIESPVGIGHRRVFDSKTKDELGLLKDPKLKKVAMAVLNAEKEWREANLKKLGFERDEDTDGSSVSSRGGGGEPDDDELVGEGAIELTLLTAGMRLFNPTGDRTMANKQTFTPDYDAYGATVEQGRLNAFNLSRSMYNQQQAIELPDFGLIQDNTSLRFYLKDDEDVILVGIRGTDVKSWTDLYTWAVIGAKQDFRMTTRFQDDLQKLLVFQKQYPMTEYYYVGVGSSLAGSIADRFLDMGLMDEAITYNPSIEKKYILNGNIHNHRVYLDTDPLFMLMGQYSPNTEIRKNASAANFYNPIKEKDFLIKSHSIFPVYNPAFEGGGMMGAGKTYTIEEWKAIFDAKLEKKRQQIEARAAKKKDTAKAKRARAKERRDERAEIPDLETPFRTSRVMKATPPKEREPEPEPEEEIETTKYKVDGNTVYVEDAREGLAFDVRGVWDDEDGGNFLGLLRDFREIAKRVLAREKPKAPRKRADKKLAPPAPASARVELREELVAAQPREPEGQFAQEAEPLQLIVSEIAKQPQRAYMMMLKSPKLTEADRRLLMSLQSREMAPMRKVKLLARSGLARKLMEILGLDESAFQGQRARMRIADTMEKRTTGKKVRDVALAPLFDLFDKQEAGLIRFLAGKTDKKDGESILRFIDYVAKKVADCAIGTWVVAERMLSFGPSSWSCDGRNDIIGIEGMVGESTGGTFAASATMFLTDADEKNVTCLGYVRGEPRFGLNFASEERRGEQGKSIVNEKGQIEYIPPVKTDKKFFFPQITRACMDMIEKIDGVRGCSIGEKRAGMGNKRRKEWRIVCDEIEPFQKRLKPEQKERIAKAEKEKAKAIGAQVGALVTEYKDIILERGALLVERVEASLTPAQLEAIEAYEVKVSKPVVIAKKKKRLAEVEKKIAAIQRIDISAMRYMLLDPDERRREDEEVARITPLRRERDKLKREIAALEK